MLSQEFVGQIRAVFGADAASAVLDDPKLLAANYSQDKSFQAPSTPPLVVLPTTLEQTAAVVRLCVRHRVRITVRGAGSGLEGGCIPLQGSIVLETTRLRRFDVDAESRLLWVGAGWTKMEINKKLQPLGLLFGPDPASNPSIGGMVSTSGSGMSTLRYGTTRENVVSLRVVTAQGEPIQTRQAVRKASTGLELTQLYIGSEGTLGVVCEACVRVYPLPSRRGGTLINFATLADACNAVVAMRNQGDFRSMLRCELVNAEAIRAGNNEFKTQLEPVPTILLEFAHTEDAVLAEDARAVKTIFSRFQPTKYVEYANAADLDTAWEARRGCYMAARKVRGAKRPEHVYMSDVVVPLKVLARNVAAAEADFRAANVPCIICAHIADGNFHVMVPFTTEEEKRRVYELDARMIGRAVADGGACSGEHGIGMGKVRHLEREHGSAHVDVQRRIKAALDPHGLFNPGKFYVPAPAKL